jgi:diguanylate cyclase (GGDEF)-like protein
MPLSAYAQNKEQKTVRVGWYESAFHSTDSFGRLSGYGYEYQQRVSTYTGWNYEYVEGSWSELFEMLVAGEIDLLSDVSYTPERAEQILYSAEAMGSEDYHVFIAPDNTEIRPDDFSTLNGKRVGVNKNSIQEQLFLDWAQNHGVHPEIVESTEKTPVLLDMLARGEFDALVTLDTYGNSADVVPVGKVGAADAFFGISKSRPDLKQDLDVAMNRILEENRDFNQQMTERYNKASSVNRFLTADEVDWLSEHGTIRVGFRDDFLPFSAMDKDTGKLTGALSDYLSFAATCQKNATLDFEVQPFATSEEALQALQKGEIDCVFPINLSAYDGEQRGVIITDPYISTEMYAAVRSADRQGISPEQSMTVAVLKGHISHETFLKDYFPNWKIQMYDTVEDCFKAVGSGDADCTLVSNYRINRVIELCSKYKLTTLATGEVIDISFAVKQEDDRLYSILNKITRLIPNATLNSSLTNYSFAGERISFTDYLRDNLPTVVAAVAIIAVIILLLVLRNVYSEAKAAEGQEIISQAEQDPLTGLYNRYFFIVYVNRHFRDQPKVPMDAIVVNIERFHTLNALNGRDYGDKVLCTLAGELKSIAKKSGGITGRVGSDHFDLYCPHRENYQALLDRLQSKIDALSGHSDIHLRMGVMPWQEGLAPDQMFARAWTACSTVRGDYKTRFMVYNEELREREEFSQRLENDLEQALKNHELEVFYQPKFNIRQDQPRLSSAEALVRWRHPELGMISPGAFIPLFEGNGQISTLDRFVWEEAARQIARWRDQYGVTLPVSVNLSRVDVFDKDLMDTLDAIVAQYGLERCDLILEVTESAYTDNAEQLIEIIRQLREQGYKIEMDDFGSGYSSLNMLSSIPVDVLKMDMGFIRNIERNEKDLRLVELIVDIADYLKVPVIAEGVETQSQLKLLRDAKCDLVQGYYFSRPLPPEEFEQKILCPDTEGKSERRDNQALSENQIDVQE